MTAHDPADPQASGRTAAAESGSPADERPPPPPAAPKGRWEHPRGRGPAALIPVVYGIGVATEAAAEAVMGQLAPWVRTRLVGVEEVTPAVLDVHGLVIVLSSDVGGRQKPRFRELRQVGERFRAARPLTAADAFVPGSGNWHRASTLWVLYTDEALGDPDARALVEMACASYVFAPGVPFTGDLLELYESGVAQARRRKDPAEAVTMTNWAWLGSFGIHDVAFATTIKNAIEARCRECDDPASPKMARPIPGVEMNRLELVLFAPDHKPPADPALTPKEQEREATNFTATGARAVRLHLVKLTQTFAGTDTPFEVPERYRKAKNKQPLYRRLYLTLRAVTADS
ncbi:hypothetical protein [Amycolatopsis sp. lyj-23]|uniref:hypothetical protein n=1 Tax=Amycolatopsis sp. lyj-23 TaxID=2789283 RepID=UPI00397C8B0D